VQGDCVGVRVNRNDLVVELAQVRLIEVEELSHRGPDLYQPGIAKLNKAARTAAARRRDRR
jgi:hypothetical protein